MRLLPNKEGALPASCAVIVRPTASTIVRIPYRFAGNFSEFRSGSIRRHRTLLAKVRR
jgi:hypothetical protein